jgi:hypothetical protein
MPDPLPPPQLPSRTLRDEFEAIRERTRPTPEAYAAYRKQIAHYTASSPASQAGQVHKRQWPEDRWLASALFGCEYSTATAAPGHSLMAQGPPAFIGSPHWKQHHGGNQFSPRRHHP